MSTDQAIILVLLGILGVYAEFIWHKRGIAGFTGSLLAIAGLHSLAGMRLTGSGITLIGAAAALYLVEAFWVVDLLAGFAAIASLSAGWSLLTVAPRRCSPALPILASVVFGCLTIFLCREAKRARRNKWHDLRDGTPLV